MNISGSTSTTTNTVCSEYMIIGPGELPDRGQIVRGARHQIAGAMFVKERERLIDEVPVKLLSHVVLDVARHADQNAALQE